MAFKVNNETKIGALATVSIALLIIGYNYLQGKDFFSSNNNFYAKYEQVDGLAMANPIKVKGMNVGRVTEMIYNPNTNYVVVKFSVRTDVKIPIGSIARIVSSDILGSKAIQLEFVNSINYYKNNDTIKSGLQESLSTSVRAEILPVKQKAENLLSSIDSVLTIVKTVLNPKTRASLSSSIQSIQSTLDNLNKSSVQVDNLLKNNTTRLDRIFANIESITLMLKNNEQNLSAIMSNMNSITDSLRKSNLTQTINNASIAMIHSRDILEKINKGDGTMGLLVNDPKLYNELESSSKNLSLLLEDMRKNPNDYVHFSIFGRKKKTVDTLK